MLGGRSRAYGEGRRVEAQSRSAGDVSADYGKATVNRKKVAGSNAMQVEGIA
jgi:hypothetical protein